MRRGTSKSVTPPSLRRRLGVTALKDDSVRPPSPAFLSLEELEYVLWSTSII